MRREVFKLVKLDRLNFDVVFFDWSGVFSVCEIHPYFQFLDIHIPFLVYFLLV